MKIFLKSVGALVLMVLLGSCAGVTSENSASVNSTTGESSGVKELKWQKIISFSGTVDEKLSETFLLGLGEKRVTYTVDGGSQFFYFIYIPKEGTHKDYDLITSDFSGETAVRNEQSALQLEAGRYYIHFEGWNLAGKKWTVVIEELK